MSAINAACRGRGGSYASYSCKAVSWDDVSRGTVGGSLSCWGANITDTYLKSKEGQQLFTVRSDNWNEQLGTVSAERVAVVASKAGQELAPVTLKGFLERLGEYGGYAGLDADCSLYDASLDSLCSIRFQTTFLPASSEGGGLASGVLASLRATLGGRAPAKVEFCTEAYNYNTMSDDDPRNLILLCTTQGVAVQQDGRGTKKLLHHAVDGDGKIHRYWLEAEETRHQVGGEQRETAEERQDALARGKATASVIGTEAMGQRFNVLMTIQVPLRQKPPRARAPVASGGAMPLGAGAWACDSLGGMQGFDPQLFTAALCAAPCSKGSSSKGSRRSAGKGGGRPQPPVGRSSAARVSRGSEYDTDWKGMSVRAPSRHASEHVTVTVVIYNTVADGVPSEEDVVRAIDDMESLYAATGATGRLGGPAFDFMKAPLQVQDVKGIQAKLAFQPPSQPVQNFNVFPAS